MDPYRAPLSELKQTLIEQERANRGPEMTPEMQNMVNRAVESFREFHAAHPEFTATRQNFDVLLDNYFGWDRVPTANDWRDMAAMAVYERRYIEPTPEQLDSNPETMPLNELRNVTQGLPQRPDTGSPENMTTNQLAVAIKGSNDIPPEWGAPLNDLRSAVETNGGTDGNPQEDIA